MSEAIAKKAAFLEHMAESVGRVEDRGMRGPHLPAPALMNVPRLKTAVMLAPATITPDPDQPRKHFDEESLSRLADSLKARGVLQPIRVRPSGQGGWIIVAGERRWRAAVRAELGVMPCIVVDQLTKKDVRAEQLIENCLREDLDPIERAGAIREMMREHGMTQVQVAQELSLSEATVSRSLMLLELPESDRERVARGELKAVEAYELARSLPAAPAGEASPAEAHRRAVREGLRGRAPAPRTVRHSYAVDGARVVLEIRSGDAGPDRRLRLLVEATKQAKKERQGGAA